MGRINIVRDDGTVVSVDESIVEHAHGVGISAGEESAAGAAERMAEKTRHERYGGVAGTLASAAAGALDVATVGGYGKALGALGDVTGTDVRGVYSDVAQEHPTARAAGELAAFFVPGGSVAELAGAGAKALGAGTGVARLATGAAYGAGGAVASSSASGDPLTVESLVEGATIGGVLNYGMGALGDKLLGAGRRAAGKVTAAEGAEATSELLSKESPAYQELVDARQGAVETANATNAEVRKQAAAWEKYSSSTEDFIRDRNGFNKAMDEVFVGANSKSGALPTNWSPDVTREDALDTVLRAGKAVNRATALRNTDLAAAVDLLRPVRDELAAKFDLVVPDLPARPGQPVAVPRALPGTIKAFAGMRPDTVAEISNGLTTDLEKSALAKFTTELGTIPGVTPTGTLADVYATLAQHTQALEAIGGDSKSLLVRTLKWGAKKGLAGAGGAAGLHLGGPIGGVIGLEAGRAAADKLTAAALEAKVAMQSRIQAVVARFGGPGGKALQKLGPVTSYLSQAFPSGKKDRETNLSQLAKNRVADLANASVHVGDSVFTAVQPIIGHPSGVAPKVSQHINNALQSTLMAAPRDPGTTPRGSGSDWAPSPSDAVALAYRLEALHAPLDAIGRVLGGEVHPAAIDALRSSWPATLQAAIDEVSFSGQQDTLSPGRTNGYSALMGPMSGLTVPANVVALQGMYLPGAAAPQGGQQAPGASAGRPPATGRTNVAGSNVNSLISQG